MWRCNLRIVCGLASIIQLAVQGVGCSSPQRVAGPVPGRDGRVYYLDGAGGGGVLTNWGNGVRDGLKVAGFEGDFLNYRWQTGLGVAVDQIASAKSKRSQAAKLASMIRTDMREYPDCSHNVIGLSAGTAVAVFMLEELGHDHQVNNVVLLGSSLDSDYDLTEALKSVRHRLYVFTSSKDTVLKFLVPLSGTADRKVIAVRSAGLSGFRPPPQASSETRQLYAKVVNIAWVPEFEKSGNYGSHTGTVGRRFVQDYVAPLVFREGPRFMQAGRRPQFGSRLTNAAVCRGFNSDRPGLG